MYVYVWVYISLTGNFSLHLHIAKLLTNVCMCMYECTFLSLASISIHASDRDDKLAVNLLDTSRSSMNCRQRQQPESISSPISDLSLSGSSRFLLRVFLLSFLLLYCPFLSFFVDDKSICKCVRNYSSNLLLRQLPPAFHSVSLPLAAANVHRCPG